MILETCPSTVQTRVINVVYRPSIAPTKMGRSRLYDANALSYFTKQAYTFRQTLRQNPAIGVGPLITIIESTVVP